MECASRLWVDQGRTPGIVGSLLLASTSNLDCGKDDIRVLAGGTDPNGIARFSDDEFKDRSGIDDLMPNAVTIRRATIRTKFSSSLTANAKNLDAPAIRCDKWGFPVTV